jgi:hypothetical protein
MARDKMSQSHVFTIRSRARESGTATDFTYVTEAVPEDSSLHDAIYLQSFLMPVTFYVIDGTHRTILLAEGPSHHTVLLPVGNYSADQLATEITTRLNAVAVDTYLMSLNRRTGKFTISKSGVSPHPATLTPTTQRLAFILGLELSGALHVPVNGTATFPACANLKPSPSILIVCDLVADGVLANVPAPNVPPFGFIDWQYSGDSTGAKELGRKMRGAVPVGIRIVDSELGEVIDLNGSDGIEMTICTFERSKVAARILDMTVLMQRFLAYKLTIEQQQQLALENDDITNTDTGAAADDDAVMQSASTGVEAPPAAEDAPPPPAAVDEPAAPVADDPPDAPEDAAPEVAAPAGDESPSLTTLRWVRQLDATRFADEQNVD